MVLNTFIKHCFFYPTQINCIPYNILRDQRLLKWKHITFHYGFICKYCKYSFAPFLFYNYYFTRNIVENTNNTFQKYGSPHSYYNALRLPYPTVGNNKMSNPISSNLNNLNKNVENEKDVNENTSFASFSKNASDINKNPRGFTQNGNPPFNNRQNNKTRINAQNISTSNNGSVHYVNYVPKYSGGNSNSGKYANVNNTNYYNSREGNMKKDMYMGRETNSYRVTNKHSDTYIPPRDSRVNMRINQGNSSNAHVSNTRENRMNFVNNENRGMDYSANDRERYEEPKRENKYYGSGRGDINVIQSKDARTNFSDHGSMNEAFEQNEPSNLSSCTNTTIINRNAAAGEVGMVPDMTHLINGNEQDSGKYNKGVFNPHKNNTNMHFTNKHVNNINSVRNNENQKMTYTENTGVSNSKRNIVNSGNFVSADLRNNSNIDTSDGGQYGSQISGGKSRNNNNNNNNVATYQGNNILYEQVGSAYGGTNYQTNNTVSDRRKALEQNINYSNNRNISSDKGVYDFAEGEINGISSSKEFERRSGYGSSIELPTVSYEQQSMEEMTENEMNKINFHNDGKREFVPIPLSSPKKVVLGVNSGGRNMHITMHKGGEQEDGTERKYQSETDRTVSSPHLHSNKSSISANLIPSLPNTAGSTANISTSNINTSLNASLYLDCRNFEKYMYKEENILTLYFIRKNYMKGESKEECHNENDKIKYVITWTFSNGEKVTATGYHTSKKASKKLCIEELLKKLKSISLLELEQMTKWMVNSLNVVLKIDSKNVETKFDESTNMYQSVTEWKVNNKLFRGRGVSEYEKIAEMIGSQNLYMSLYNVKNELIKEAERPAGYEHYKGGISGHGNTTGYNMRQSRNKAHAEEHGAALNNVLMKNYSDTQLYKYEGNAAATGAAHYNMDTKGPNGHYHSPAHFKCASYEVAPPKPVCPPPLVSSAHMYNYPSHAYNVGSSANTSMLMRNSGLLGAGSGGSFSGVGISGSEWSGNISNNGNLPFNADLRNIGSEFVSYNLTKHDCSVIQMLKHNIASKYKIIQTENIDVVPNGYKCILHWECKTGKNNFKISSVGYGGTKALAKAEASYDMLIKNNLIEYVSPEDRKNAQYIKDLIPVDLNKAVNMAVQFIHNYGSESWSIFLVNMFREIIAAGSYGAATRLLTAVIEASKRGREEIDEANKLEEEKKTEQRRTSSSDQEKATAGVGTNGGAFGREGEETLSATGYMQSPGKLPTYEPFYGNFGGVKGTPSRQFSGVENIVAATGQGGAERGAGILGEAPSPFCFQNLYSSNARKHINNQYVHRLVSIELWEKLIDECVVCLNSKLSFHCISLLQEMELDRSFFISTAAHNYYKKYRIMLALELQANINQSVQEKKDFEYLHDNKSLLLKIKTCTLPVISCTCLLTNEEKEWLKTTQMKEDDIVLLKPHDSDMKDDDVWAHILMGSITSAKYDNTVFNVNIRLFSADNSKKPDFKCAKYKMYLLLNIVTHERMLQVLKAITFIGAIPSQPTSPYCFTPEIRFLILHTYNKYSRHIAQKGRVNEEIADYEKMKMDFFNNESIKNSSDDLIAEYRNESKNPYEDLLNESLNKQIDKDSIGEIDKFLVESVNLPTNLPLNDSQKLACISAMTRRLTLVQGPPGTGKTHVACAIVDSWHRQNSKKKILAVADSNVAANNLVEGLKKRNIQAVRVGAATDVDFHEDAIKEFTRYKELLKLRKDNKLKEAKVMKALLFQEAVKTYNVVIATCVGSGHEIFDDERFERVIIDECAQSIEPSNLIPLGHYCNNLVLIGDHKQLPPTIISTDAAKMGLDVSLLERFITAKIAPVHLLSTQRRMHLSICAFPNMHFYDNKLKTANVTEENRPIIKGFIWPNPKCRVAFVDVSTGKAGSKFENAYGTSKFNLYEIEPLISVLKSVINEGCVSIDEIGILTAYDAQKSKLKSAVQKAFSYEAACRIEIDSVDGFQGKEKDLILFSAVRSNASNELGFLRDARRMNVMLTRAKRGVILFGDQFTLANDPTNWLPWLTWIASKRAIIHITKLNDHLDSVDYSLFDKLNKINKSINFNSIHVEDNYYYYGNDMGFSNDYNNMDLSSQISTDLKASLVNGAIKDGAAEHVEEEIVENWEDLL